jgi:hypothetical protein
MSDLYHGMEFKPGKKYIITYKCVGFDLIEKESSLTLRDCKILMRGYSKECDTWFLMKGSDDKEATAHIVIDGILPGKRTKRRSIKISKITDIREG